MTLHFAFAVLIGMSLGVLFQRARLTKIGQHGPLVSPVLQRTVQLGQGEQGDVEIAGDRLEFNATRWLVSAGGRAVGQVTSALYSPRLDKNIGYAMVPVGLAAAANGGRRSGDLERVSRSGPCHGR